MSHAEFLEFDTFVKHCFSQRRKKLQGRLKSRAPGTRIADAFADLGLSPDARAEVLSVADFIALFNALSKA